MKANHEFTPKVVSYPIALILRELGYDVHGDYTYTNTRQMGFGNTLQYHNAFHEKFILAPTYYELVDWLVKRHSVYVNIVGGFEGEYNNSAIIHTAYIFKLFDNPEKKEYKLVVNGDYDECLGKAINFIITKLIKP